MPLDLNQPTEEPSGQPKPPQQPFLYSPGRQRPSFSPGKLVLAVFILIVLASAAYLVYMFMGEQDSQPPVASKTSQSAQQPAAGSQQAVPSGQEARDTNKVKPAAIPAATQPTTRQPAAKSPAPEKSAEKKSAAKTGPAATGTAAPIVKSAPPSRQPPPATPGKEPSAMKQGAPPGKTETAAPKSSTVAKNIQPPQKSEPPAVNAAASRQPKGPTGKGNFTIIIASYRTEHPAAEEVSRWVDAGYQAFVVHSGGFFRVGLGEYATKDEAHSAAQKLKDAFEYGYFVGMIR